MNLLIQGKHYNKYMQKHYDKYKHVEYEILFESGEITNEELSQLELEYIKKYDTYNKGFNLTLGGEGGNGLRWNEERKQYYSEIHSGENNGMSKLTKNDFFEIVNMLKEGKTNREIAEKYNLHDRYVSLIRHKKRWKQWWNLIEDYQDDKSNGQKRGLTKEEFIEIVKMIKDGYTNAYIEKCFSLSSGTVSRIRHKKLYKRWWKELFGDNDKSSTTIETSSKDE